MKSLNYNVRLKSIALTMALLFGSAAMADLTCKDEAGRAVAFASGKFIFQGLDSAGLPSETAFQVIGSTYTQGPGGPSYSEYITTSAGKKAKVRLTEAGQITAEVWAGSSTHGEPVFAGGCTSNSANMLDTDRRTISCFSDRLCGGPVLMTVSDPADCNGLSWDEGYGCNVEN